MRRPSPQGVLLAAVLAAMLAAASGVARGAAADGPALHLSQDTANLGSRITVTGTGLVAGTRYQLEICGIGGTSNSCDVADAAFAVVGAQGTFRQNLQVDEPPTPCPCTVHAAPYGGPSADPVDTALRIPGLRYLPDAVTPVPGIAALLDASVTDESPPLTAFGAGGSARVTVTFANLGGGPADDPVVVLTLTRGGAVTAAYPLRWSGGPLAAGARRSLVYDVPLPGGWFRDFGIGVRVAGADGRPVTVRTLPVSVRPWGELAVPAALALGVGLILLGRRRRHRVGAPGEPADPPTAGGEPDPGEIPEVAATGEPAVGESGPDFR